MFKNIHVFIFLVCLIWVTSAFSAPDTLVLQEGLDGYKGTTDTWLRQGYWQASHEIHGNDNTIKFGGD